MESQSRHFLQKKAWRGFLAMRLNLCFRNQFQVLLWILINHQKMRKSPALVVLLGVARLIFFRLRISVNHLSSDKPYYVSKQQQEVTAVC